jgi:hypothetical protein
MDQRLSRGSSRECAVHQAEHPEKQMLTLPTSEQQVLKTCSSLLPLFALPFITSQRKRGTGRRSAPCPSSHPIPIHRLRTLAQLLAKIANFTPRYAFRLHRPHTYLRFSFDRILRTLAKSRTMHLRSERTHSRLVDAAFSVRSGRAFHRTLGSKTIRRVLSSGERMRDGDT